MSVVFHSTRIHRTTFQRIPIRGEFTFAAGTPAGQWVKTGQHSYAAPFPQRSGENQRMGDPVTNTGRVKFWQGAHFVASDKTKVIENYPSKVHQEQDMVSW